MVYISTFGIYYLEYSVYIKYLLNKNWNDRIKTVLYKIKNNF
jgi:hypothetical protein